MEPGRIAVRTELVRELLLDRIAGLVEERFGDPLPAPVEEALGRLGGGAARRGYLTRIVEHELFERARAPMPWLAELLADADAETVASSLASAEGSSRPDPDDERSSWRVPGPGGHVRHYLAVGAARNAGGDEAESKRRWLAGFYLRCCEETRSAARPSDANSP